MMKVHEALELYIERVCAGNKVQAVEVAILPKVLEFYCKVAPQTASQATEQEAPKDEPERLLTASEVAELLGFTKETHCKPQAAIERLAREGKLHEPIRYGRKTLRWQKQWIDAYINGETA